MICKMSTQDDNRVEISNFPTGIEQISIEGIIHALTYTPLNSGLLARQ